METFKPKTREGHFKRIDRRTGPRGQLIKAIDLEIFIQLTSTDSGGLAMSPMKVWIVKISTAREDPLQKYLRLGPIHSKKRRIMVFYIIFIVGICGMLGVGLVAAKLS